MATEKLKATFIIRTAQADDLDRLSDFIKPFVDYGKLLPRTFDELEEWLPNYFIAQDDKGAIVGCAALEVYSKKLAEIRSLAVSPDVRGLGIGKALVEACVQLARDKKIYEVMAVTSADTFFMSCGFDFTLPGEKKALFIQTRDDY